MQTGAPAHLVQHVQLIGGGVVPLQPVVAREQQAVRRALAARGGPTLLQ